MSLTKRILLALAMCIGVVVYISDLSEMETHTELFCAYGKVFVKFKEGGRIWGTIMLDDNGAPIQCHEGNLPSVKKLNKGNVI